ncbi:MAG: DNA repair protein RecO [Anaerolineales bacterium]|nr:DNA repair protein RecO [Anaerolineales bacterium]
MLPKIRSQRVEAIVLRHADWGEADRLLWLYTRELGKVRAVAKGARKPRSRKAGHLEPFTCASLLLAWGRDIYIVTQAEANNLHLALRQDLLRIGYASYITELLDRFTYEEGENPALYHLLADTLKRLDEQPDPEFAVRYYEVRLLDLVGFRPQLMRCTACEKEIQPEDQYFSAAKGGVLCPRCGANTPGVRPISMLALKTLRHMQRSNYAVARRLRLSLSTNRELENLVGHYLTYLLERSLNTPAFLRQVRSAR